MATPKTPKVISIIVTGGVKGQPITVRNRNTGDIIKDKNGDKTILGATAKAVVDLQNSDNGYTPGDIIDFIVSGEKMGGGTLETSGSKGESITIAPTAIITGVARGI